MVELLAPLNKPPSDLARIERVLLRGDLSALSENERISYYNRVCETLGLNPLTKPFEYIELNKKLVLYATKGCAEQLRQIDSISIRITNRQTIEGVYVVTAAAQRQDGRVDESTGVVQISGLKGDMLANAMMKAETKAKRRVTLSICGLNMLDETEVETISKSQRGASEQDGVPKNLTHGDILNGTYAKKNVSELNLAELHHLEDLLTKPNATVEELQTLERVKEQITTFQNIESTGPVEAQSGEKPKCCGRDLLLSAAKTRYYCQNWKDNRIRHLNMLKEDYEAVGNGAGE